MFNSVLSKGDALFFPNRGEEAMSKKTKSLGASRIMKWAETAEGGARYVYHRGQHAADNGVDKGEECSAAWDLYRRGEVALFQRLVSRDAGIYEYTAVRVRSPRAKQFLFTEFSPISAAPKSNAAVHVGS